ncbi:MAG: hypothetical protein NVS2B9_01550 [Myxococcales bacterium]
MDKRIVTMTMAAAVLGAACAQRTGPDGGAKVAAAEVRALLAPEPAALAGEYHAHAAALRLFGTQAAGTPEATATLADTGTWATRSYREGEAVARNLVVETIRPGSVVLRGPDGSVELRAGADAAVRLVRHESDEAARDEGRHVWSVRAAALAKVQARRGLGIQVTPFAIAERQGLAVNAVEPAGVFDRLGLQAGDVIVAVDGAFARPGDPARIAARLTTAASDVVIVRIARGAEVWDESYVVR